MTSSARSFYPPAGVPPMTPTSSDTRTAEERSDSGSVPTPTPSTVSPPEYSEPAIALLREQLESEKNRRELAEVRLRYKEQELEATEREMNELKRRLQESDNNLLEKSKKIDELEKRLLESEKSLVEKYKDMSAGESLVAMVALPVAAAPVAVGTVVKGFQAVGSGIMGLFEKKDRA